MALNRKSRSTLKYTGKSYGSKFLTKREKNELKAKTKDNSKNKKKQDINRTRFNTLIKRLAVLPKEERKEELFEKFNLMSFAQKQRIRKTVKQRKTELTLEELEMKILNEIGNKT